ncbi:MAG: hypothetical protein A2166_06750 [Omnitrophica WOR_2 bacterium RBG_13_41_10]|nr:MAG: hypothetical protein A2166_06750 [Omnitrophica WOR_2 bacterium RBG_13_41_10]
MVALGVYVWLKGSLHLTLQAFSKKNFSRVLGKLFFVGIVLPALVGFFSVTYKSCSKDVYEEVIADRSYLIERNREQVATSLQHIIGAVIVWSVIVGAGLCLFREH